MVWLAIGEHDDDLLVVVVLYAIDDALGAIHTVICGSRSIGIKCIDRIFQRSRAGSSGSETYYGLGIVVCVPQIIRILIISGFGFLIARKLHNGDAAVGGLLRHFVNEAIDGRFQNVNLILRARSVNRIVHRAGDVQDQDDVHGDVLGFRSGLAGGIGLQGQQELALAGLPDGLSHDQAAVVLPALARILDARRTIAGAVLLARGEGWQGHQRQGHDQRQHECQRPFPCFHFLIPPISFILGAGRPQLTWVLQGQF